MENYQESFCLRKAFDAVSQNHFGHKMKASRIAGWNNIGINGFLAGGTVNIKVEGYMVAPTSMENDVSRASVLGPTSFLISHVTGEDQERVPRRSNPHHLKGTFR